MKTAQAGFRYVDCEEQDLIMRAARVKHMRSRLQSTKPESTAKKLESLGVHCALRTGKIMGGGSWRPHCAGLRKRDFQSGTL